MRIGIDATDISIRTDKGGVYRYIINLVTHLRDIDVGNRYILFFNYFRKHHRAACEESIKAVEGKNVDIKLTRIPRNLRMRLPIPVNAYIGKVDIFHGPFDQLLPVAGCKKVVTIHDLRYFDIYPHLHEIIPEIDYPMDFPGYKDWNLFMRHMKKKVRRTTEEANHIITVSGFTRDALVRLLGVPREKIHVVHNGIGPFFKPIRDQEMIQQVKSKYGIEGRYFVFVGQMDPFKNILRIGEAYHMIKNSLETMEHKLLFITPTPPSHWFYKKVIETLKALSIDRDVHVIHNIPDHELPYFYNGATALLLPSLYEGFGFPVLEAMACGTPVIASHVCSLSEVAGDAALMVDPYSAASIAEGMTRIVSDSRLSEQLTARGLERARQFSWEKAAQETLKVYHLAAL